MSRQVTEWAKKHRPVRWLALLGIDRIRMPEWLKSVLRPVAERIPYDKGHGPTFPKDEGLVVLLALLFCAGCVTRVEVTCPADHAPKVAQTAEKEPMPDAGFFRINQDPPGVFMLPPGFGESFEYTCARCGKRYRSGYSILGCLVAHPPGACCHYGESPVE
jgi:hypothetical protein